MVQSNMLLIGVAILIVLLVLYWAWTYMNLAGMKGERFAYTVGPTDLQRNLYPTDGM